MKIKRVFASIPFLVGFFLIIYAGFGFVYIQKQSEWRSINEQLIPARIALEKPAPDPAVLESQLDEAESDFEDAWAALPQADQVIDLYDALVEVARLSGVELANISASQPKGENYQGLTYSVISYSLSVKGSKNDILYFVSSLVDGPQLLQTCRVGNLNMNTAESANATGPEESRASMHLYVYTRPD